MHIISKDKKDTGFTIVELIIATSVFSLVLLVALGSFLQVGRLFYKGVSLTATQNIATQVLNDISSNMQTASSFQNISTTPSGYTYFCIGSTRYTFTTHNYAGQQVSVAADSSNVNYNPGSSGGSFGLLKDTLPGNSTCSTPCAASCGPGGFDKTSPTEMLGDQMRLASITITQSSATQAPNLYNITMVMAYGDESVLNFTNVNQPICSGGSQNQAFCSVVNLSTAVIKGART